jgi:hypothetical protein
MTPHRPPPSHVKRHMAWLRVTRGIGNKATWLEQQWHAFTRASGRKRRLVGIEQAEFDRYLEALR